MKVKTIYLILFIPVIITVYINQATASGVADILNIGLFSQGNLSNWEKKEFVSETLYSLVLFEDKKVLKAISQNSGQEYSHY